MQSLFQNEHATEILIKETKGNQLEFTAEEVSQAIQVIGKNKAKGEDHLHDKNLRLITND